MSMARLLSPLLMLSSVGIAAEPPRYQPPKVTKPDALSRQELVQFMRELADAVYEKHVVRDAKRRTFGMTYEYLSDGRKMQDFGLDTMHDGAWFMSAMVTAHRVDPEGRYLERALTYQVPFYVNIMRNSDRLFPKMKPREGQEQFTKPVKGWCPRGWDDGLGIDLYGRSFGTVAFHEGMRFPEKKASTSLHLDGDRVEHAYFTSSHHLLQDLADGLLNIWLTTRDPQVAAAVMQMHEGRREYGRPIPVVRVAAGITNNRKDLFRRSAPSPFDPTNVRPWFAGACRLRPERIAAYNDGAAWSYRDECARAAVRDSGFDAQSAWRIGAMAQSMSAGMEAFYPNGDYRYGDWLFDLGGNQAFFTKGTGKLGNYVGENEPRLGTRGIQVSALAAAVLPAITADPNMWEQRYRKTFPNDQLVRIVDDAPQTDGVKDASYSAQLGDEQMRISLVCDPRNLNLFVESNRPKVTLRIAGLVEVEAEPPAGVITLEPSKATAANSKGDKLEFAGVFRAGPHWTAELRIPWTFNPSQGAWINGTDHGRLSIQIDEAEPRSIYLLSTHERFVKRLESLAIGTIALWRDHWKKHRSIPSGYYRSGRPYRWNYGDAGNYAHLIKCISFWLIHRDGKSEWELIRQQAPAEPIPAKPLPDSVLEVQGLK